jgi:hypothetical protein
MSQLQLFLKQGLLLFRQQVQQDLLDQLLLLGLLHLYL